MNQMIDSRYQLEELVGQGGMGEVFRAQDTKTGEAVAVKVLKPEVVQLDPELVERFVREGEALRRLNHPNIVKMLDTVEENARKYIVMEYVPGGSLRDLLLKQPQIPLDQFMALALEIADALTRAHHLRVIHRDIKPGNILLAADGSPRLTDFGVAQIENLPKMTQTGSMVGTFAYLSPEACRSESLDERTDIWSFGVLLYEMLTGQNPFDKKQAAATITAILQDEPPDLRTLRPDVAPALADLILRMLQKERTERIGSVRLVGAELESIIRGLDTPLRAAVNELSEVVSEGSRFDTPPTIHQPDAIDIDIRKPKEKRKPKVILSPKEWENLPSFIQIRQGEDGSEFVKVGPIEVTKSADGTGSVKTGAVNVITDADGREQVDIKLPGVIVAVIIAVVVILVCVAGAAFLLGVLV